VTHHEYTDRLNAFEVLYAADTLKAAEPDVDGLSVRASRMVSGVLTHRRSIDGALNNAAIGWTVPRMPVVDRNILRLAAFELMYSDISAAIVINEAVDLAKEYSTAGSGKFVNGVLDSLATTVRDPSWTDTTMEPEVPPFESADGEPGEPDSTDPEA
jgi:transcription antitermination protein NusB